MTKGHVSAPQPQAHHLDERVRQLQRQEGSGGGGDDSPSLARGGSPGGDFGGDSGGAGGGTAARRPGKLAPWPAARANPYADAELQPAQVNGFTLQKSFKVRARTAAPDRWRAYKHPIQFAAEVNTINPISKWLDSSKHCQPKMIDPPTTCTSPPVQGHLMSVANVALHPTKPILVTASDDKTWKMWHLPGGELVAECWG